MPNIDQTATQCTHPDGDDDGACFQVFRNKQKPGLCRKCEKLNALSKDSVEYATEMAKPQCKDCGVVSTRLTSNQCGGCRVQQEEREGRPDVTRIEQEESRAAAMAKRVIAPKARPTLPLTTEAMQTARQAAVGHPIMPPPATVDAAVSVPALPTRYFKVNLRATLNGKKCPTLGDMNRQLPDTILMSDLVQKFLDTWNPEWTSTHPCALAQSDVSLRFRKNQLPLPNSTLGTLRQFYEMHIRSSEYFGEFGNDKGAQSKSKNPLVLNLELFINTEKHARRTEIIDDDIPQSVVSKRKRTISSTILPSTKRLNAGIPRGTILPRGTITSGGGTTEVTLVFANDESDEMDDFAILYLPPLDYNHKEFRSRTGRLRNNKLAQGKTKIVFPITLAGRGSNLNWVLKRFINVGDRRAVSTKTNRDFLIMEFTRLRRFADMLRKFYNYADYHEADVCKEFEVTDCWLARETYSSESPPKTLSPASGAVKVSELDIFEDPDTPDGAWWLIEPLRSAPVKRYSGTMNHIVRESSRDALTISAFVHFAYLYSEKMLVFADIQAQTIRHEKGQFRHVLFDVMTHTPNGGDGVGDHGVEGIAAFEEQHVCNYYCKALYLHKVSELHEFCAEVDNAVVEGAGDHSKDPGTDDLGDSGRNDQRDSEEEFVQDDTQVEVESGVEVEADDTEKKN